MDTIPREVLALWTSPKIVKARILKIEKNIYLSNRLITQKQRMTQNVKDLESNLMPKEQITLRKETGHVNEKVRVKMLVK